MQGHHAGAAPQPRLMELSRSDRNLRIDEVNPGQGGVGVGDGAGEGTEVEIGPEALPQAIAKTGQRAASPKPGLCMPDTTNESNGYREA